MALARAQEAAGKAVRLHELAGRDHFFPLSHGEELVALIAPELEKLKG